MLELQLRSCLKNEYGKCAAPEETVSRIKEYLKRLNIEYTYKVVSPGKKVGLHWAWVKVPSIDYYTNGKGISPILAEASAFSELIERLSAYLFDIAHSKISLSGMLNHSDIYTSLRDFRYMPGYAFGHQDDMENPLRIEVLLADPRIGEGDIEYVKHRDAGKHWVDGCSLLDGERVKVPLRLVNRFSSSNGLAAGNTLEEAIVQASCEVFERYAMRMLIERRTLPTVDPATIDCGEIRGMIDYFRSDKVEVMIKDMSMGGLLPVLGILTINGKLAPDDCDYRILQPGADFNLLHALRRCFTERMQGRRYPSEASLSVKYYGMKTVPVERISDYWDLFTDRKYYADMSFMEEGEPVVFPRGEPVADCLLEIEEIKKICRGLDTDCVVVEHTLPASPLYVVRVIIPGLSDLFTYIDPVHMTKERLADESEVQTMIEKNLFALAEKLSSIPG